MRLLSSTDFALRLLMLLAARGMEAQLSVEALSRELGGLSRHHLHKIVQDLAALGVLRTVRGAGGGVVLAQKPEEISVGKLIRELEGDQAMAECFRPDGGSCTLIAACRLRSFLCEAKDAFYRSLDGRSVADCLP
jgi:Rrf2 family nitric oxide-sensitive transcriptional repressor